MRLWGCGVKVGPPNCSRQEPKVKAGRTATAQKESTLGSVKCFACSILFNLHKEYCAWSCHPHLRVKEAQASKLIHSLVASRSRVGIHNQTTLFPLFLTEETMTNH